MTIQADTLYYDTLKVAEYQQNKRYDYASQMDLPEYSWFDTVSKWFNRLINNIFGGTFEENVTKPVMIGLFFIIVAATLYFLYRKRPELFQFSRKTSSGLPYNIEAEDIHVIDFEQDITSALNRGDYRFAVRLKYLQTLRIFSDNNLINWQIHKTPTEYIYELKNADIKSDFRTVTTLFLQIRYGNYPANARIFNKISELHNNIVRFIKSAAPNETN
ncbi:MAG: DUF4129 domain-containing protein [Tannerella sp.]|jgi:hypothetical protein|nr:DUF4129 domain-containing protein [Tannerella sp.]